MLYGKFKSEAEWEKEFNRKLKSFLDKSPAAFSLTPSNKRRGVIIHHVGSKKNYFVSYDYSKEPRDYIHSIKEKLSIHYPVVIKEEYEEQPLTNEEVAEAYLNDPNNVPKTKKVLVSKKLYRIDREVIRTNSYIIKLIGEYTKDGELTPVQSNVGQLYTYKKSLVMYFRNYRSGKYNTIEEASEELLGNSTFEKDVTIL